MLIQSAIDLLSSQFTTLSWVERYGGVVQTFVESFDEEGGEAIQKKYPVSCSVNEADCATDQRYQDLCPDDTKKSVVYWEVLQALQNNGAASYGNVGNNKQIVFVGSARLVVWLNTDLLGINECNTAAKAMRSIMPLLFRSIQITDPTSPLYRCQIDFEMTGEVVRDINIFSKYSFSEQSGITLHPYDYFAVDVNIRIVMPVYCAFDFNTGVPIDCTDDAKL